MFKRYWFILCPNDNFGAKNIGVTAFSVEHAKKLVTDAIEKMNWLSPQEIPIEEAEITEDIDVRILDQNHVRPNMGVVSRQGIWFPNLNS